VNKISVVFMLEHVQVLFRALLSSIFRAGQFCVGFEMCNSISNFHLIQKAVISIPLKSYFLAFVVSFWSFLTILLLL
jgi:hypothetical protein